MKFKFLFVFLVLLLFSRTELFALEIIRELTYPPAYRGEEYPANFLSLKNGVKIMLTNTSPTNSFAHNENKTIWAVNYHQSTDYNGTDLIIERGDKILVFEDIWDAIKSEALDTHILNDSHWNRLFFKVKAIKGNELVCHLSVINNIPPSPPERDFIVYMTITDNGVALSLRKGK